MENNNLWIILSVVLLVGIIVYFCAGKKSSFSKGTVDNKDMETDVKIETFLNTGGLDHLGALLDNQYDLVQSPDQQVAATEFADLVSSASDLQLREAKQSPYNGANMRPMERLASLNQGKGLMPRTSESITPYSVQLGSPQTFAFNTNQARVNLRSPQYDSGLSMSIRGDIPIHYFSNVPLVSIAKYGRDSQNFSGLFSAAGIALYNKYNGGGYRSLPLLTAGAGQAGGYGGASSEVVMDNYA
jgi:hypothetical protein